MQLFYSKDGIWQRFTFITISWYNPCMAERSAIMNKLEVSLPTTEQVLWFTLQERPNLFKEVGEYAARSFIEQSLELIRNLEHAALDRKNRLPKTRQEAWNIPALCIYSAPGTAEKAFKNDRYKEYPWSAWMDRNRLLYALSLTKKITETRINKKIDTPEKFHEAVSKYGPEVLYSGRPDEQEAVERWLGTFKGGCMPKEKFHFIGGGIIDNTFDQVSKLYLPEIIDVSPGEEVGFILHSPQAARMLYMMQEVANRNHVAYLGYRPFPHPTFPFADPGKYAFGPNVRVFPMPSPRDPFTKERSRHYTALEIRGLIYYRFYANPSLAANQPFSANY